MTIPGTLARPRTGVIEDDGRAAVTAAGAQSLLALSAGVVGALSYGTTLLVAHLLPAEQYSTFAATVAVLATAGVVSSALIPLPLAAAVRRHGAGSAAGQRALAFATGASIVAGVVAAVVVGAVTATFAGVAVSVPAAAAALGMFVVAPVFGVLQGTGRFAAFAAFAITQVGLRMIVTAAAATAGWGVTGALLGFLAGDLIVAIAGILLVGPARRPSLRGQRDQWIETGRVSVAQFALSAMAAFDVVSLAALTSGAVGTVLVDAAGYQAVAAIAKAPVYLATGAVLVVYPSLRRSPDAGNAIQSLRTFLRTALPVTAVIATVPADVVALVLPAALSEAVSLAPVLAVAGLGHAVLAVLYLIVLGVRGRLHLSVLVVSVAAVTAGPTAGWAIAGVSGLATGAAVGVMVAVGCTAFDATGSRLPLSRLLTARGAAAVVVLLAALVAARGVTVVWVLLVCVCAAYVLRPATAPRGRSTDRPTDGRIRVLHLGFEDHAMPGAGGGSIRTREINRRLASTHDITVLTTRYPGSVDRVEDGVHYVHVGLGEGRTRLTRFLGYVLLLPYQTRRRAADMVVEDFFAPISTMAAPLWSGRPTVGSVQWFNAVEKARQYHLPVHLVERLGLRSHDRLIAMSHDLADRLRTTGSAAHIDVIGNGVDAEAFATAARPGRDVVFVGRLESAQKGIDLLLDAWSLASPRCDGLLLLAGRGPDEERLRKQVEDLGLADRVRFLGHVAGPAKYELMAAARLVVVPSRFETFGMVAVEALATATPVIAFDIPCLREVVPDGCGERVGALEPAALADALVRRYEDRAWLDHAGVRGRRFAARFDWNKLAARQASVYRRCLQRDSQQEHDITASTLHGRSHELRPFAARPDGSTTLQMWLDAAHSRAERRSVVAQEGRS